MPEELTSTRNKANLTTLSFFILIPGQLVELLFDKTSLQSTFWKVPSNDNIPMLVCSLMVDAKEGEISVLEYISQVLLPYRCLEVFRERLYREEGHATMAWF
jgi:hypothetical protein